MYVRRMGQDPIVVRPGEGHLLGNVEFLARTTGEEVRAGPGSFVLVPPGTEHGFRNDGALSVRMLNIHAPGGFDRRIGLSE
jgi:mannose-6-phosphate isomerase-like protein (cupin superfamily)